MDEDENSPEIKSKKKKKKKDRERGESPRLMQDSIPAVQKSRNSELVEHGSSYGDNGCEDSDLDAGASSQHKFGNLESGKDIFKKPRKLQGLQDNFSTSMEPPEVPASLEKPRKKKIRVKQEMLTQALADQSSGDTAPSHDSETSAAVSSDGGGKKAKKRKRKHADEEESSSEAKKRKKEKKKKKDRGERREKKKKHKKEKKLKSEVDDGASIAASSSSARLSAAETESLPDDSEPGLDLEAADVPAKSERKHKKQMQNGPAFEATLDSSCLEHSQKVKKKKRKKD